MRRLGQLSRQSQSAFRAWCTMEVGCGKLTRPRPRPRGCGALLRRRSASLTGRRTTTLAGARLLTRAAHIEGRAELFGQSEPWRCMPSGLPAVCSCGSTGGCRSSFAWRLGALDNRWLSQPGSVLWPPWSARPARGAEAGPVSTHLVSQPSWPPLYSRWRAPGRTVVG